MQEHRGPGSLAPPPTQAQTPAEPRLDAVSRSPRLCSYQILSHTRGCAVTQRALQCGPVSLTGPMGETRLRKPSDCPGSTTRKQQKQDLNLDPSDSKEAPMFSFVKTMEWSQAPWKLVSWRSIP